MNLLSFVYIYRNDKKYFDNFIYNCKFVYQLVLDYGTNFMLCK